MSVIEKFRAISVERQVGLTLALLVVISGGTYLIYNSAFKTRYEVLASNLRTADAATVLAELDKNKTPYQLRDGGQTVLVPSDRVDKSRIDLMSGDLPLKGTVGFELFNKSDMGVTEFAQKINYQRALQGELARTIMSMDEVEEARVHLSLSETTVFKDDQKPSKASITILTKPGKHLSYGAVRGIQRLIAAAVPDLDADNVVVLDNQGVIMSGDSPARPPLPLPPVSSRDAIEDKYKSKLRDALLQVYPGGGFHVSVSAALNPALTKGFASDAAARDYALRVNVIVVGDLSADQEKTIRNIIIDEIKVDPNLGDSIVISSTSPQSPAPTAASPRAPALAERSHGAKWDPLFDIRAIIAAILVSALMAVALLFRRAKTYPQVLTHEDRQAYIDRLKALLDGANANARS